MTNQFKCQEHELHTDLVDLDTMQERKQREIIYTLSLPREAEKKRVWTIRSSTIPFEENGLSRFQKKTELAPLCT